MEQHKDSVTEKDLSLYRIEFICAIQALDKVAYKRHKETIANFNKNYIKTEIFPRTLGRKIAQAEEIRHASDYDDFYIATKSEAEEQINTAEELIKTAEEYCIQKIGKENK